MHEVCLILSSVLLSSAGLESSNHGVWPAINAGKAGLLILKTRSLRSQLLYKTEAASQDVKQTSSNFLDGVAATLFALQAADIAKVSRGWCLRQG